jgi:hypothetical protein
MAMIRRNGKAKKIAEKIMGTQGITTQNESKNKKKLPQSPYLQK